MFRVLTEDDFMSDSLEALMNNDVSNRTNFLGNDFPAEVVRGQFYYQPEDDIEGNVSGKGKLYLCYNPNAQTSEAAHVLVADLNNVNVNTVQFEGHTNNLSNPHKVTASQVNTYDKQAIDGIVATLAKTDFSNVPAASYPIFKGATTSNAGTAGLLPAPGVGNSLNFLRGDGTWAQIKEGYEGFPVGFRMDWDGDIIPSGWVEENGQVLNRADYPDGWNFATTYGMVVTDASWINDRIHGKFSSGNGSTTFRMPDRRNCFSRYNNTNIGLMNYESTNNITEVNYQFGVSGSSTISIPNDGSWSGYITSGIYNTSSGWPASEVLRFRKSGGNTYPQNIITRSIRKMK